MILTAKASVERKHVRQQISKINFQRVSRTRVVEYSCDNDKGECDSDRSDELVNEITELRSENFWSMEPVGLGMLI